MKKEKGFFRKLIDKLDNKMKEKSECACCCCDKKEEKESKSCCKK